MTDRRGPEGRLEQRPTRWKAQLLQVLADELLTPVTILNGVAQTFAQRPDLPTDQAQELALSAQRASSRLRRLVENIHIADQLTDGLICADRRMHATQELVDRAVDGLPEGDRARVTPHIQPIELLADMELATKALTAVLENALEFSASTETVDVRGSSSEGCVDIAVADRGPGIPRSAAKTAAELFVQGHLGDERPHRGLGLGLYVARSIMDLHQGAMDFRVTGDENVVVLRFPSP